MNGATKVGAYALGLAVVFGGALGAGRAVGPIGEVAVEAPHGAGHRGEAAATAPTGADREVVPGGLQISQGGYTLRPETDQVKVGERGDFRFSVIGPDGRPVTRFTPQHEKKLHFIVVRRDLTGFQHLHPTESGGGVWSVPLTLPAAGEYRAFADFAPVGAGGMTLGMDLSAAGDYRPEPRAVPARTAKAGDYTVTLAGDLVPGRASRLTLTVAEDGRPVTDLQPYLGAYGHLVALRDGDLAYLHVHPDGEPGDGRTASGPGITFYAEVPSAGTYRLFLDFQHAGTVHTAEFTAVAAPGVAGGSEVGNGATPAPAPTDGHGGGDHAPGGQDTGDQGADEQDTAGHGSDGEDAGDHGSDGHTH
ncbi:hypothetical protein FHS43_000449 [Streptosporangium becharense]|uniref:Heavy metal-binding domain-containing protein n=1 Tax=Streptosporangium becharense TaxID=1816182 RepID=A0A7W9MGU8_9ACTN|nr:hypothetical protein [Streptosporangium becharense]MBB2909203.1 hypothetical protein [Streptosporangium becharense]MBB5819778.1 hypothetical protein [Streptosporangium becharense]